MEFDQMPPIVQRAFSLAVQGWDIASAWLLSPAAWSQFTLLVVAYYGAVFATKKMNPIITHILTPQDGSTSVIAQIRLFILMFLPLLAYAFTGIGETLTRSIFGSGAVIASGKRVFLFLAIRSFAQDMLTDKLLKLFEKFFLIPVGAPYALGLLDMVAARLEATVVPLGNLSFNLLWLIQFFVVGGVIFWLGRWSNDQS
jgi:potassium efflux system protein